MALITYREALHDTLDKALEENENVILMGENAGTYGGMYGVEEGLPEKYGKERIRTTPLSKSAVMGTAIGAAMTGLVPVVEISSSEYIPFIADALINQAAKMSFLTGSQTSVPLVIRIPTGVYPDSSVNESQSLENMLFGVPGLKIVAPTTPHQARDLLKKAIEDPNPVVFLEDKGLYETKGEVPVENIFNLEESVKEKEGTDLTIVSWGKALKEVRELVTVLNKEGIYPEVINPLTLQPLDIQPIIDSVIKTGRLVIVHDGPKTGGIGAEIVAQIIESEAFSYLDSPVVRITGADVPVPFSRNLKESVVVKDQTILDIIYSIINMD